MPRLSAKEKTRRLKEWNRGEGIDYASERERLDRGVPCRGARRRLLAYFNRVEKAAARFYKLVKHGKA